MKILYFDCFSGISGDMTIGALLDLGIGRELFLTELSKLNLEGYTIEIVKKTVNGISGTDINVVLKEDEQPDDHEHHQDSGHLHSHDHGHGLHHDHTHRDHGYEQSCGHGYDHHHDHGHDHPHGERGLAEIEQILDHSSLSDNVKSFSKKVFREIAAAEAKVHGKSIDEVHFHEVGAVDSIVDIAGTAICLELLGVEKVYSSVLHDGSGMIECRHGFIPVPVPAVLEMLRGSGIPLYSENVGTELVTPTGMGLIKCMASNFGCMPPMVIEKTSYGLGKRNTGRLNALRVILGETYQEEQTERNDEAIPGEKNSSASKDSCSREIIVLETNIDDTSAEILGYTMTRLLDAGALDAFYTPIFMKKNRPAYMLTVLALPGTEDRMAEIILSETSTLGIRTRVMKRYCMERETAAVDTPYGRVRVKIASWEGIRKASPEYEDCRKIAESTGLPLVKVYGLVAVEAAKLEL